MPEIPLSVDNIKRLKANLKDLSRRLKDDIPTDIERHVGAIMASHLREEIGSIPDVDGNYLGTENPNASVVVEVGLKGHDLIWRGAQITFVEFGTGEAGAASPYGGPAMAAAGYHPDPTKKTWWYWDAEAQAVLEAHGLPGRPPGAPMLTTAMLARTGQVLKRESNIIVGRAVKDAITV
jgi:hypothetical protein